MLKLSLEKDSFADTPQDLVHVSVCAVCPTKSLIAVASGSSSSSGGRGEKQKREEGVPKIMMYRFGQEEWKLVREERVPQGAGLGEGGDHTSSKQRPLTRLEIMKQQLILKRQEQLQKTGGTGAPTGTGSLAAGSVCNGSASHVTATSLAWRPDGMALACGHSNGTCTIYSPEQSGSWTPSETQSKEAVVSLFWSLSPLEDRKQATLFQQTLYQGNDDGDGTLTGAGHGKKRLQGSEKDKEFPYAWDSLDLLFCLDKKWTVFVFSCGQFLVGKISCGTILGPEIASITPAHIQYSSELMHGIVSGHKASENSESEGKRSGSPTKQTGMNVVTFSLQGLVKKKRFVARVSRSMWRISTEATNVHAIVERCVTTWKKVNDLFTQRTEKLSSLLEEHGSLRSPEEDLLAFLAVGELSPAMEQFVPVDIRTFHAGIEKGIWAVLSALRFELPGLLEKFYLFVLEAQKGDQSRRFSGLDVPIKELSKKVRDLGETVSALNTALLKQFKWLENLPRDISDGLARNVDRAQEKWPDTSETKFIAESIQYGLDTVTEASVGWMELLKVAASLLALTKEAKKASILGEEIVDLSEMDSYTLETESGLPEEVRTCCSPPIVLLGSSAYVMYAQEGNNRSASEAGMMFLDDDDDDGSVKPPKEPVSLDELLQPARVPSAYEVIASWSQKKVRPEWGEEKLGLECLGPGARVIDLEFIWDGHLAVLYTMGELRTHLTVLSRNKGGAWACLPGCTAKVPDDARRLICDERSGVVIVCCASERTQVYTTKEKAWF